MFELLEFREPLLLLTALLAIPVYILLRRPIGRIKFSSLSIWPKKDSTLRSKTSFIPPLLLAIAMALLGITLAGPRIPGGTITEHRQGISIMMVVDKSGSMAALDMSYKNQERERLDAVKDLFVQFVNGDGDNLKGRPDDAIGIISFAAYPDSDCPLTLDHLALNNIANDIKIVTEDSENSTAIGDALGLAVERLRDAKTATKIAILMTDGVNNSGYEMPLDAARIAAQNDIRIYTVGIGTNGMAPIRVRDFFGQLVLRSIPVEIDEEMLKQVANITGGEYFRATDNDSLKGVYEKIDQLEKTQIHENRYTHYDEKYEFFLFLSLLLAALGWGLQMTVYRRSP